MTLPLADLLLTKLQVYEVTEREYKDMIAFLYDQKLGDIDDHDTINQKYIAKLCSNDWGLWKTVNLNLERLWEAVPTYAPEHEKVVKSKITQLRKKIEDEPKSFGWRMRARVGDRVKWYELPEADREVVDSRPVDEKTADVKASK